MSRWPFVRDDDGPRLGEALQGLVTMGVVNPHEAGWVRARVIPTGETARLDGPRPPWGSLALWLGDHLGSDAARDAGALAGALLAAPETPDALALGARVLRATGSEGRRALDAFLDAPLPPVTPWPVNPDAEALAGEGPTRATLLRLLPLTATLAGCDPTPWRAAAGPLAELFEHVHGLARIWLDAFASDLREGRLSRPLLDLLGTPSVRGPLLVALAGNRQAPLRIEELRSLLASEPARAHLEALGQERLAAAREGLPAAAHALLDGLAPPLAYLRSLLLFRGLVARSVPSAAPVADALSTLAAAGEALEAAAPWPGSWELRRFDLRGAPVAPPIVGRRFVEALVLQALADLGRPRPGAVAALLARSPADALRYYDDFPGLPPDADDLGLALQLAAAEPDPPRAAIDAWLHVMEANIGDDGTVPTWFYLAPGGGRTVDHDIVFGGDDCTGVRLSLLLGLVAYAPTRYAALVRTNAARVVARWDGRELRGCYHWRADFALLLFARFAVGGGAALPDVADVARAMTARIAATQRLDGGWGSPQTTAFHAEALAIFGGSDPLALRRAIRYLCENQRPDGTWTAEATYIVPSRTGDVDDHRGADLTTAFCARALARCAQALAAG